MQARGPFEVRLAPLETHNQASDAEVGRMSIDKELRGDLEGTGCGEMLTGGSPATGSAGYVAIERITGTLHGRTGSFLLQHSATMTPDGKEQRITIVPGSGTGDLTRIEGSMSIEIDGGEHAYVLDYSLPDAP